ncbi:hypothetical protein V8F06_012523, partial [Rhypophila decipiens]
SVSIRGHGPRQMPSLADPNLLTSENCREQHLKCDRVTPICGRCQNAGRECRRTGLRVRETKAPYAKNQKWVRTPRRIVFIHETNLTNEGDGLSPDSGPEDYLEVDASGSPDTITDGPSRRSSLQSPIKSCSMTPVSPRFPRDILTPKRYSPHDESLKFIRQPIYIDHTILPFTEAQRARLMRHYVQKLAIWLDLCDPGQSFQTVVPIRAGTCPILLNSIMALAGRHLAHVDKAFPSNAYVNYSQECVRQLNVWAGDGLLSEDVFAALIIMRVMAELEVPSTAKDNGGNLDGNFLLGLQLCVQHQKTMLRQKSLGAAAFWVGLRQEIYNAVATQSQVKMLQMDVLPDIIDREVSAADDYVWANRAVVHCAEVLNYCFGPNTEQRRERWEELMAWNRSWSVGTADTYVPIYRETNEVPFPEIWYNQSCHVIGTQHHLLAELFLTYHHPDLPVVGPAAELAKESIKSLVREICGIGLGNSWTPPSMFTACMAIHVFGQLFPDRRDQEQMMAILRRTEHEHGRPTAKVQAEMVHYVWHWKPVPDYIIKQEHLKPETLIWANQQLRQW